MKKLMENWRKFAEVEEAKNKDGKEQGADGKACWKGKKYAGTDEDGKDKCVPMEESSWGAGGAETDLAQAVTLVHDARSALDAILDMDYEPEHTNADWEMIVKGLSQAEHIIRNHAKAMDGNGEEKLEEEPAKGKKSSKTYTNPDTGRKNKVSYGQKGAKIAPGTDKGDSYCARSNGIKKDLSKDKQNDPNTPNNLSRKKWKCSGDKSMKE